MSKRCAYCRIKIDGRAAFHNGAAFHRSCYMWQEYGIRIKEKDAPKNHLKDDPMPDEIQSETSEDYPWGGCVEVYDAEVEKQLLENN